MIPPTCTKPNSLPQMFMIFYQNNPTATNTSTYYVVSVKITVSFSSTSVFLTEMDCSWPLDLKGHMNNWAASWLIAAASHFSQGAGASDPRPLRTSRGLLFPSLKVISSSSPCPPPYPILSDFEQCQIGRSLLGLGAIVTIRTIRRTEEKGKVLIAPFAPNPPKCALIEQINQMPLCFRKSRRFASNASFNFWTFLTELEKYLFSNKHLLLN